MNIRSTFVAEKDRVLLFSDLSRVEDRFVQIYSGIWAGDRGMIKLANSRDIDTHAQNAIALLHDEGLPEKEIRALFEAYDKKEKDKSEYKRFKYYRQLAKQVTHGTQRGLRGNRLSENLFVQGIYITPKKCDKMIDAYLAANPAIKDFYFTVIEEIVKEKRELWNCFGRRIQWPWHRITSELFRKAYSWLPQSSTGDLMNTRGIRDVRRELVERRFESKIMAQMHDEGIYSCLKSELNAVKDMVSKHLEKPVDVLGERLIVPVEHAVGYNWGEKMSLEKFWERETKGE